MINIHSFVFNPLAVNTYILFDDTKECIIIDPACSNAQELRGISEFISKNSLLVKYTIITHGHFDHVMGNKLVFDAFKVDSFIHSADLKLYNSAHQHGMMFGIDVSSELPEPKKINENDLSIKFGNSEIQLLHLPGHSPGSIGIYAPNDNEPLLS